MAIAYVVTAGEYSDYSIWGVFTSKENAEKYIAAEAAACGRASCHATIEEWELDRGLRECEHTRWVVDIMADSGEMFGSPRSYTTFAVPENAEALLFDHRNRRMLRIESVESADHAMKLAVEARQKWLRENCRPSMPTSGY